MDKKLTIKQQKFADEYIISGNATKSAIKAGYAKRSAHSIATENLQKPAIKAYIDQRLKKLEDEKIANMVEVMQRLTSLARGETTEQVVTNQGGKVSIETRNVDKLKALELIGKRYGAWTDKKEINGNLTIDIGIGDYDADN